MSQYILPVVNDTNGFEIKRIFCVGRNYRAHALEMGVDPDRNPPFFFAKFPDAYAPNGSTIAYPPRTEDYHHEIEMVVAIGKSGKNVKESDAFAHVYGYATSLDMTRRDLQLVARKNGRPWDTGKNFPFSAPMTALVKASDSGELLSGEMSLTVNGETRQITDLSKLIWNVNEIIADLSTYVTLQEGDIIMTGTPEGVGPVHVGDKLVGKIAGLPDLEITIGPKDE